VGGDEGILRRDIQVEGRGRIMQEPIQAIDLALAGNWDHAHKIV